ncbi:Ku protein [Caulobacter sp. D4A]|uniref:non-homologous end joining protein Ku n=1 Tax=unclassified Caulobacter TaxID=2648921 RepID=UPI000D736CA1|nr:MULTISPECIES: Ku protein [unclassified Caulobacter]PXA87803.1 Ku protein [Caulobacter sp. D4A]PXA96367.1 Ku protein [Caulobacter sp. D5]
MAARPTWQGHLRLSLVTCPVALYTATNPGGEVRFNLLHPKTHNRIKMVATDPDLGPVERSDLVKGYEVEKDRYIVVTPEEIESVRLESTRTIDIERFVDVADIDRLYWDNPYFLVPDGKLAVEAYSVIRDAMAGAKRIALGRVVMHTRERLLAIEPRGKGLIAWSLRSYDEVRDPADLFDDIPAKKADASMIAIARKIIEQQDGPFEPQAFKDRYEDALRALIKRKEKGGKAKVSAAPPEDTNVVDLMEALRKSLGGKAPAKPPARKPAAKGKASATKTARKAS